MTWIMADIKHVEVCLGISGLVLNVLQLILLKFAGFPKTCRDIVSSCSALKFDNDVYNLNGSLVSLLYV